MADNRSKMEIVQALPLSQRIEFFNSLSPEQALDMQHDISFMGRVKQQVDMDDDSWDTLMVLAGRGFGKTYMGAHWVIKTAKENPKCRIALIGETVSDVRDVIVLGDSGIMKQSHPSFKPIYNKSNRVLTFPNGSICQTYSGTEPEDLRGHQWHFVLIDELAKMRYQDDVWDQVQFCLRLGKHPRCVITTTPRPTKLIKSLARDGSTKLVTGSSSENTMLPAKTLANWKKKYEGTRLGRQELHAEILDDNPNGLFHQENIDENRVGYDEAPRYGFPLPSYDGDGKEIPIIKYDRVVVAVDPAVTNNINSDDTGITVTGRKGDHGYLIGDFTIKGTPNEWVAEAIKVYHMFSADCIVYESNQGGMMTQQMINNVDNNIRVVGVRAFKSKQSRAEPVSALYEQNRIHHIGILEKLETEIVDFDPTLQQRSPNRLDALVYGFTELFGLNRVNFFAISLG